MPYSLKMRRSSNMEYHETGIIIVLSPSEKWDEVCDKNLYIMALQDYLFNQKPEHIKDDAPWDRKEIYRVRLWYGFDMPTEETRMEMRQHRDFVRDLMVGIFDAIDIRPAEAVKEYVI